MKNRFSFFIKGKSNKPINSGSNDVNLSFESEELSSGFDSFFIHKRNTETAEDAISIRSSIDCSNRGFTHSIKRLFSKYSKASISTKNSDLSRSYHQLNAPKDTNINNDRCQMKIRNCNGDLRYSPNNLLSKTIPESGQEYPFAMSQIPVIKRLSCKNEQSIRCGVTTAAIMSRHAFNSSAHPNIPWIQTEQGKKASLDLSKEECNRQNIIHELIIGELSLLNDLKNVITNYKRPMENLNYLTESESFNIFYTVESVLRIYEKIVNRYENEINEKGIIESIGKCLIYACNELAPVIKYCTHLYVSKSVLEEKRKSLKISEFLRNCSTTKFSRKLDIWDFLDKPRSRLMKYPLLIDRILKSTPTTSSDYEDLLESKVRHEKMLAILDEKTGEEMCNFYLDKIAFIEQNQYLKLVKAQKVLLIEASVKVGRSINRQKVHAFLFKDVLVFTKEKLEETNDGIRYNVYGNPLPTTRLVLEDIDDGEIRVGSFRNTFISDKGSKNVFRLTLLSNFLPDNELSGTKANTMNFKLTNSTTRNLDSIKPEDTTTNHVSPSSSAPSSPVPPDKLNDTTSCSNDNFSSIIAQTVSFKAPASLPVNNLEKRQVISSSGSDLRFVNTPDNCCEISAGSYDHRLLKNAQTIIQVEKYGEKQLWLQHLRKLVAREIKKQNNP